MIAFDLYADTHVYSPIVTAANVTTIKAHENLILLGDIIDLANAAKKDVNEARELYHLLKLRHGKNYVDGNHERMTTKLTFVLKKDSKGNLVLFTHGDLESNREKWTEYRQKEHGAGAFKRKVIIPFIREAEEIIERKPKKDFLDRAARLCKMNGAKTYVCGHFHVDKLMPVTHEYEGETFQIILVPRGYTRLYL